MQIQTPIKVTEKLSKEWTMGDRSGVKYTVKAIIDDQIWKFVMKDQKELFDSLQKGEFIAEINLDSTLEVLSAQLLSVTPVKAK